MYSETRERNDWSHVCCTDASSSPPVHTTYDVSSSRLTGTDLEYIFLCGHSDRRSNKIYVNLKEQRLMKSSLMQQDCEVRACVGSVVFFCRELHFKNVFLGHLHLSVNTDHPLTSRAVCLSSLLRPQMLKIIYQNISVFVSRGNSPM